MKNDNEKGVLAIEASLVLFFLIFFMLFIWNFSGVFSAQNAVSHASMQATQAIASDNLSKALITKKNEKTVDVASDAITVINQVLDFFGFEKISEFKTFDKNEARNNIYEKLFYYFLGGKEQAKALGVDTDKIKIEIDEVMLGTGVLRVKISYSVKLKFGVFGFNEMQLTKFASCKLFGSG